MRGLLPLPVLNGERGGVIGANFGGVSRAQRGMNPADPALGRGEPGEMMRCRPGIVPKTEFGTVPGLVPLAQVRSPNSPGTQEA